MHDGDVMSMIVAMTDDARQELKDALNTREYYVGINDTLYYSSSSDVSDLVFREMSREYA